jgi:hypothetical protein
VTAFARKLVEKLAQGRRWTVPGWTFQCVQDGSDASKVDVVYSKDGTDGPLLFCAAFVVDLRPLEEAHRDGRVREACVALDAKHDGFRRQCAAMDAQRAALDAREAGW